MDVDAEREFREYVAARQGALFRSALLLTGHRQEAEDLVQAALTKLAMHWNRLRTKGSVDAYVRKIMYHQQVSWWRRRSRRPEQLTAELPETVSPTQDPVLRMSLDRALRRLTAKQRAVVVLRYYEDLPEAE